MRTRWSQVGLLKGRTRRSGDGRDGPDLGVHDPQNRLRRIIDNRHFFQCARLPLVTRRSEPRLSRGMSDNILWTGGARGASPAAAEGTLSPTRDQCRCKTGPGNVDGSVPSTTIILFFRPTAHHV